MEAVTYMPGVYKIYMVRMSNRLTNLRMYDIDYYGLVIISTMKVHHRKDSLYYSKHLSIYVQIELLER